MNRRHRPGSPADLGSLVASIVFVALVGGVLVVGIAARGGHALTAAVVTGAVFGAVGAVVVWQWRARRGRP